MMVYWADASERVVKRSFIPQTPEQPDAQIGHPQTLVHAADATHRPTDVSVDWITGNLYWTEASRGGSRGGVVAVATGDGRYRCDLVTADLAKPTSLAVDPEHGLIYWTDAGDAK